MSRSPRKRKQIIDQAAAGGTNGVVPPAAVTPPSTGRTRGHQIVTRPVEWLIPGWLAVGDVSLLAGPSSVGKTTLMAAIAAQVTGGPALLPCDYHGPKSVAWYTSEEQLDQAVTPRLSIAGAHLPWMVYPCHNIYGQIQGRLSLPSGLNAMSKILTEEEVRLVILDPITSWLDSELTGGGDVAVRQLVEGLQEIARRLQLHIMFTRHDRKGLEGPSIGRVSGSGQWTATPRTVIRLQHDARKAGRYIMRAEKGQVAGIPPPRYYTLPMVGTMPRFAVGDACNLSADELSDEPSSKTERTAVEEAMEMLKFALADGERSSTTLWVMAQNEGHSPASIKRALARLKPDKRREKHESTWKLIYSTPKGGFPAD